MKLLVYIHSLENGGAERVVANLANFWVSIGWEITVVTVAPCATDFYALDPAIHRIGLDLADRHGGIAAGAVRTARRVQALRSSLQQVRPDVALSAMHTANVVLALAARGMPGVLALGSEHNFPPLSPMGVIWETMRSLAYGQLQAVVALTGECADWLDAHTRAQRVPVIPNPVSWPLANQEPYLNPMLFCRPGRQILLGVGRLSIEKNFSALINGFARLAARHPEWDLVILGDGPFRSDLRAQVHAAGLDGRVFLPGRVGNMSDWYERAGLYAMTSLFEGFPNTLVEAMASGLPVVSVDCDTGPRDIIRHWVDGFLVPPGEPHELEAALGKLMGNERLRSAFAARAVDVRQRFSMEKISDMWTELFREISAQDGICLPGFPGAGPHLRDIPAQEPQH
ncbi:MAG: glycosyltransferase family 4 protein [Lysobacteraceae bacterium]|nr:MAG: glycosyltransferase family 4 protein [Xanthomonadaceae bacterium]